MQDLHTTELRSVGTETREILDLMKETKEQTWEVKESIRMFSKNKELREWIIAKSGGI